MATKKVESKDKNKKVDKKVADKKAAAEAPSKKIKSFRDELVKMIGIIENENANAEQFDIGQKNAAPKLRKMLQATIVNARFLRKAIAAKRAELIETTKKAKA